MTINRPEARNALTWEMYDALVEACDAAEADPSVRVLIIRGAGGAFAAGTDISQFKDFDGDAGVAYERRLDAVVDRIERLPIVTIAEIDGPAVGGGFIIAIACDMRICSTRAAFGLPIARTLGNCLSMANLTRTIDLIGVATAKCLVFGGHVLPAEEARLAGLTTDNQIFTPDELQTIVTNRANAVCMNARSTVAATKAMLIRLREHRRPPAGSADDLIRECYGSAEFREGVSAFLAGRKPIFP